MKLAANLSRLWAELPYLDRFDAARDAGFVGVSVPFPYDMPAKETQRAAMRTGMDVVQIAAPPPNYTGGSRGFAAAPGAEARFQYDLRRAVRYCEALRVSTVRIMGGEAQGEAARATLMDNLTFACGAVPQGITLMVEPQAEPSAFLNDFANTAQIISKIGAPNLKLQFHSLHAARLGADAVRVFQEYQSLIGLIQLADAPEGGPIGSGDIDFPALVNAIGQAHYKGWIVADYETDGDTDQTLQWMKDLFESL